MKKIFPDEIQLTFSFSDIESSNYFFIARFFFRSHYRLAAPPSLQDTVTSRRFKSECELGLTG